MDQATDPAFPRWVVSALGTGITDAARLTWGFTNESWAATLPDGRHLVITRLADSTGAHARIARFARVAPRLEAAGVPVPAMVMVDEDSGLATPEAGVFLREFVEGTPGPEVLAARGGPKLVGGLLGRSWRRLADIDPAGLGLPDLWASPGGLAAAAETWAAAIGRELSRGARARLNRGIAESADLLGGRRATFVHGDLVPANILVRGRALAALLDLEAARLADALLDAAWFDWIVWFHHPAAEPAAWEAFSDAAGVDERDPATAALMPLLPAIRLLEILADPSLDGVRWRRWMEQLVACVDRLPRRTVTR